MTLTPFGAYGIHMVTAQSYTEAVTTTLRVAMRLKGESISSLSKKSRVNRRAIEDGLSGKRDWKSSHLEAFAKALDIPLEALTNPDRSPVQVAS